MSQAVSARILGSVIAVIALLTGCGGPADSASGAARTSTEPARAVPEPAGSRCGDLGDLAALTELDLVEVVETVPATSQFAAYLTEDSSRTSKYAALDAVTVFVPLDDAWTTLDESAVQQLEAASTRQALVEYAMVPTVYLPEDLADGAVSMSTFRGASAELFVVGSADAIVVNGAANAVCAPVQFAGGVLYFVDSLLLPPA